MSPSRRIRLLVVLLAFTTLAAASALGLFYRDLDAHGLGGEVVTLVMSEFGRRPAENADRGTDHGFGSVAFVVGGGVRGGVYGEYPSLAQDRLVLGLDPPHLGFL